MNIKEIFKIIKFLKGNKSCIIVNSDLVVEEFGKPDQTMQRFIDKVMLISLNEPKPGNTSVEEAAALRIHTRAQVAGENYANEHGHSIVEEVAYGRGYKAGYMIGCFELFKKAKKWLIDHTNIPYDVETNENGEPMADSYIDYMKKRLEVAHDIAQEFEKAMSEPE